MKKKCYSKPVLMAEKFEPHEYCIPCTVNVTYTYATVAGNFHCAEDLNDNGVFDPEEEAHGNIKNIDPQGNDLILQGDSQLQEFMRLRQGVFYWPAHGQMSENKFGWAIQETQHGVLVPYSGGGNHLYVIDATTTYTKNQS